MSQANPSAVVRKSVPRVSDSLILNLKSNSIPASHSLSTFTPDNGSTFSYASNSSINLPIRVGGSNLYLDCKHSYLKLTIKNKSTHTTTSAAGVTSTVGVSTWLDQNIVSIIKRLTLSCGGTRVTSAPSKMCSNCYLGTFNC